MGSSRRTYAPPPPPPIPQPKQNALMFRDGQAYNRTGGMNADPKRGVEASPFAYKPLGYTAQEAGYFGPGRYGAARRYGQDSVTNPDVPYVGNYYAVDGTNTQDEVNKGVEEYKKAISTRNALNKGVGRAMGAVIKQF